MRNHLSVPACLVYIKALSLQLDFVPWEGNIERVFGVFYNTSQLAGQIKLTYTYGLSTSTFFFSAFSPIKNQTFTLFFLLHNPNIEFLETRFRIILLRSTWPKILDDSALSSACSSN